MINDLHHQLLQTAAGAGWEKIGTDHHHGICLPLFSLHSQNSAGIGEYTDLLPLMQFCQEVGFTIIQLLPLNDTGAERSPYNALSAQALHPLFIGLSSLPLVEKVPEFQEKISSLRRWNHTSRVKYAIVRELKRAFLRDYFRATFPDFVDSAAYQMFCKENPWVTSYALFKAIKESQGEKSWEEWPDHLKNPPEGDLLPLLQEYRREVDYHIYLQFHCFDQLKTMKEAASSKGIFLKGDIPILISRDSADVWANRNIFSLQYAAGAPPDMYASEGQYWGFPLYNWEELEKSGYKWWKERLSVAARLYHLYRIDHIVGFFRIWAIPLNRSAKEGYFIPSDESTWIAHGKKILEMMLKSAPIFPIGEDLGIIPPTVRQALTQMGIPGTKVMRWERYWEEDGRYIPTKKYHPESMTTVSTHDSDTLQLWWRHSPKEAKLFSEYKGWKYVPFLTSEYHKEILRESHHSGSLFHINLLQEYLALFPECISMNLQDERINIPGKVLDHNWCYKFIPSTEQLLDHDSLKQTIRSLISS